MTGNMTEERRKEIALMIVEQRLLEEGFRGADAVKRGIGNEAQKLGINTEELMGFYQTFFPKIYGRIFGYNSVRIEANSIETMTGKKL